MEFELINPSDAIFFKAQNLCVAALSVICLSVQYGAKEVEGNSKVPIFMFCDAKQWFKDTFGIDDIQNYFDSNKIEVSKCLKTFYVKGETTSLNDICKRAELLSKKLEN